MFASFLLFLIALIMFGNLIIAASISLLTFPLILIFKKWQKKHREKELEWYTRFIEEEQRIDKNKQKYISRRYYHGNSKKE